MNSRPELLLEHTDPLLAFIRLAGDNGPKSDFQRVRAISYYINLIMRLFKSGKPENIKIAKTFAKTHGKTVNKIISTVLSTDDAFGVKPIKKFMKYLELSLLMVKVYKHFGYKKKLASLKKTISEKSENLDDDPNIKRLVERIAKIDEAKKEKKDQKESAPKPKKTKKSKK